MEISEKVLAELLSMVRKPEPREKTGKCLHCAKQAHPGCRGLCWEHWIMFRTDRNREGAKVKTLTKREEEQGLTLKEKKQRRMKIWDDLQVKLNRILKPRRGQPGRETPFSETA